MKIIKEETNPRNETIRKEYKKWQKGSKGLNQWAKDRTCRIVNCSEEQFDEAMNESVLAEETLEQAADKINAQPATKGNIEQVLDEALDHNQEQHELGSHNFENVLFIGEAGSGKSSIIRQWARDNGINLFEVRAAGMDDTDLGGAIAPGEGGVVNRLASTEFDKLDRPNSVLFLDEYNRAPKSVRTNLLELVNSHVIPDPRAESGQRYLENFLFTVAAINPANPDYDTDTMDMAELTRFRHIDVEQDPKVLLNHLTKVLNNAIEKASTPIRKERNEGRLALANALLTNKEFEFDNRSDIEKVKDEGNGLALNFRTFTNLLMGCDGTKEDFLRKWPQYTNDLKYTKVERILQDYTDVKDKANSVFDKETDSEVFKKEKSNLQKVQDILGSL